MKSTLDVNDVQNRIPTLEIFHRALLKNNFYMPSFNSSICSKEFMLKVKDGLFWVPKFEQVMLRPCPMSPKKELIVKAILERFEEINWLSTGWTMDAACQANKDWLLAVLSTLHPSHRYFAKEYMPTPEELRVIDPSVSLKRQVNN